VELDVKSMIMPYELEEGRRLLEASFYVFCSPESGQSEQRLLDTGFIIFSIKNYDSQTHLTKLVIDFQ
jgi:hypothetical protein